MEIDTETPSSPLHLHTQVAPTQQSKVAEEDEITLHQPNTEDVVSNIVAIPDL